MKGNGNDLLRVRTIQRGIFGMYVSCYFRRAEEWVN